MCQLFTVKIANEGGEGYVLSIPIFFSWFHPLLYAHNQLTYSGPSPLLRHRLPATVRRIPVLGHPLKMFPGVTHLLGINSSPDSSVLGHPLKMFAGVTHLLGINSSPDSCPGQSSQDVSGCDPSSRHQQFAGFLSWTILSLSVSRCDPSSRHQQFAGFLCPGPSLQAVSGCNPTFRHQFRGLRPSVPRSASVPLALCCWKQVCEGEEGYVLSIPIFFSWFHPLLGADVLSVIGQCYLRCLASGSWRFFPCNCWWRSVPDGGLCRLPRVCSNKQDRLCVGVKQPELTCQRISLELLMFLSCMDRLLLPGQFLLWRLLLYYLDCREYCPSRWRPLPLPVHSLPG